MDEAETRDVEAASTRSVILGKCKRLVGRVLQRSQVARSIVVTVVRWARDRNLDVHTWMNSRGRTTYLPIDPFALVWIDPAHVRRAIGDGGVASYTWKKVGAIESGDWDRDTATFEDRRTYRALRHRLVDGGDWRDTQLYRDNVALISKGHVKWGCRSVDEFERRLRALEELFEMIAVHGYKSQRQLAAEGRRDDPMSHLDFLSERQRTLDEIVISIARDGELLFVNQGSQHRLALAKILGISRVPARVLVRHAEWQRLRDGIARFVDDNLGGQVDHSLPHPDLAEIPSRYDSAEWLDTLSTVLRPLPSDVAEVGSQISAFFAHAFAARGVRATAVTDNTSTAKVLERVSASVPTSVRIVTEDAWAENPRETGAMLVHEAHFRGAADRNEVLARLGALALMPARDLFLLGPGTSTTLVLGGHSVQVRRILAIVRDAGFIRVEVGPSPSHDARHRLVRWTRS